MGNPLFHPSVEGAQHGAKSLDDFLRFAKRAGADGAQPSNYMLQQGKKFKKPQEIRESFYKQFLLIDGISCHCPIWVHGSAWTGTRTGNPFIPTDVARKSPKEIEAWALTYILHFLDLCAELKVKIVPMFWGVLFGWELATGYPWGFWQGASYNLLEEGKERFVKKTARIRKAANERGIKLCHEIHPGTAGMCADDFNMLVQICDGDKCLGVNADPSHNWEGESWETRLLKVASRIYAAHVKNFVIRPGLPLRMMQPDWKKRAMQFTDLPSGQVNLVRYVETLIQTGYPQRYREIMNRDTAPLVGEAESAYRELDATSGNGIHYISNHLCFPVATGSFEDAMGEK